jgi:hypothetical protein
MGITPITDNGDANVPKSKAPAAPAALSKPGPLPYADALDLILQLLPANEIAAADRLALQRAFADHPGLWRVVGDMALQARQRMIEKYAAQPVVQEAITAGTGALSRSLGWDQAPMLEKLLIDQVITCWINQYDVQTRYTLNMASNPTLEQGTYWEKRLSSAQRRYLRACETLARVRKLAQAGPLQVNIGAQQVNVVGAVPATAPPPATVVDGAPVADVEKSG